MMNICFVCNGHNFAINLGITIVSILKNSDVDDNFHFHIITDDMSDEDRENIILLKDIKPFDITFYEPSPDRLNVYKSWARIAGEDKLKSFWSYHIFLKFEIFFLFEELDEILLLDVDLIVFKSLKLIYNIDLGNKYVATLGFDNNVGFHSDRFVSSFLSNISFDKSSITINKVLTCCFTLFNLKKLRDIFTLESLNNYFYELISSNVETIVEDTFFRHFIPYEKIIWVDHYYQADIAIWRKDEFVDSIFVAHCSCGKIYSPDNYWRPKYKNKILKLGWSYLALTPWFKKDPIHFLDIYSQYDINIIMDKVGVIIKKIVWFIPIRSIRNRVRQNLILYFKKY